MSLFDRDYHTPNQISERQADAAGRKINLHIWGRKEIENFAIAPGPIRPLIALKVKKDQVPSVEAVRKKIFELAGKLENDVMDSIANEFFLEDRASGLAKANARAREVMANWSDYDRRLQLVPGKVLISRLSHWAQKEFDVSFNAATLAGTFIPGEVPGEISTILAAILDGERLRSSLKVAAP